MDRLKTYVINLPKDLDRRGSILKETGQFPCLDIEMIEAVYGKELSDKEKIIYLIVRNIPDITDVHYYRVK